MTVGTTNAGFDHLASWFPADQQPTPEYPDNAEWTGWYGRVEVDSPQPLNAE